MHIPCSQCGSYWYYGGLLEQLIQKRTPWILSFFVVVVHPNVYSYSLGELFPFCSIIGWLFHVMFFEMTPLFLLLLRMTHHYISFNFIGWIPSNVWSSSFWLSLKTLLLFFYNSGWLTPLWNPLLWYDSPPFCGIIGALVIIEWVPLIFSFYLVWLILIWTILFRRIPPLLHFLFCFLPHYSCFFNFGYCLLQYLDTFVEHLDKTQLVSGSWWWYPELDLSQISHECTEIQWTDFINQDPLSHSFVFIMCFFFFSIFLVDFFFFV